MIWAGPHFFSLFAFAGGVFALGVVVGCAFTSRRFGVPIRLYGVPFLIACFSISMGIWSILS